MKTKFLKRALTLTLALVLAFALAVPGYALTTEEILGWVEEWKEGQHFEDDQFDDVPETFWAYDYITYQAHYGIVNGVGAISGVGDKCFDPNGPLTYAQFITMLIRDQMPTYLLIRFPDKSLPWWYGSMTIAMEYRYLVGTEVENACVNGEWNEALLEKPINRYNMAQIVYNVVTWKSSEGLHLSYDKRTLNPVIADWDIIPDQYKEAVKTAYEYGKLNGTDVYGTFDGTKILTRAEGATALWRLSCKSGDLFPDEYYFNPAGSDYTIDFPMFAPATGYLTSGEPVSEENIEKIMAQMKEKFPSGMPWNKDSKTWYGSRTCGCIAELLAPVWYGGSMTERPKYDHRTWQEPEYGDPMTYAGDVLYGDHTGGMFGGCEGFAQLMQDALFGADPLVNPITIHQDISKLKVGDIVIRGNPDKVGCHWQIVIGFKKDSVGNTVPMTADGNVGGEVHWDSAKPFTGVYSGFGPNNWNPTYQENFIITRWPVN